MTDKSGRLHVPGQLPPGLEMPNLRYFPVKDEKGAQVDLPMVYAAAFDNKAAQQLYHVVRAAIADSVKDLIPSVCNVLIAAFTKQAEPPAPEQIPKSHDPFNENGEASEDVDG